MYSQYALNNFDNNLINNDNDDNQCANYATIDHIRCDTSTVYMYKLIELHYPGHLLICMLLFIHVRIATALTS